MARLAGVIAFVFCISMLYVGHAEEVPDFTLDQFDSAAGRISKAQLLAGCEVLVLAFYPIGNLSGSDPLPQLERLYTEYKDQRLDVAVIVPYDAENASDVVNKFGPRSHYTFRVLLDKYGDVSNVVGLSDAPLIYVYKKGEEEQRYEGDFTDVYSAFIVATVTDLHPEKDYQVVDIDGNDYSLFEFDKYLEKINSTFKYNAAKSVVLLYIIPKDNNVTISKCCNAINDNNKLYSDAVVQNYIILSDKVIDKDYLLQTIYDQVNPDDITNILIDPYGKTWKSFYDNNTEDITYEQDVKRNPDNLCFIEIMRQLNSKKEVVLKISEAKWL